jgi:hypothetical protein
MTLPRDFWEQLPEKTDAELYDIIAHPEDYLPEALAAARDELSKRNLSPERTAELEGSVRAQEAKENARAQEPLGWPMRIFIFLFCAGLVGILMAVHYGNQGYKKKASDCWMTLALSMIFHVLLGGCIYLQR